MQLTVREIQFDDIAHFADYWFCADAAYLRGMGVDVQKLPRREDFTAMLRAQIEQPYHLKKSYALIWLADGTPVGHSNVSPFTFGETAFMHLHLWQTENRRAGMGSQFVKMSLPYYFQNLNLKTLFSQPYALNPAPNKTLPKAGFEFVKKYTTTPGVFCFEQEVNLWKMEREDYEKNGGS